MSFNGWETDWPHHLNEWIVSSMGFIWFKFLTIWVISSLFRISFSVILFFLSLNDYTKLLGVHRGTLTDKEVIEKLRFPGNRKSFFCKVEVVWRYWNKMFKKRLTIN